MTATAILLVAGGLVALIVLLRVLDSTTRGTAAELRRASRELEAAAARLQHRSRRRTAPPPEEVRETMESLAACARILRSTASDSHASALASIEKTTAVVASVLVPKMSRRRGRRAHS